MFERTKRSKKKKATKTKSKQSLIENNAHGHNKHLELHFTWDGALQHLLTSAKEYHYAMKLSCTQSHSREQALSTPTQQTLV